MPSATFEYKQGPHFRGPFSWIGGVTAIGLYCMLFAIPVAEAFELSSIIGYLIGIPLFAISVSLFLAIEGIEIDQEHRQIRKYSKFLWMRYGEWLPISAFDRVTLHQYKAGHAGHSYSMFSVSLEGRDHHILIDEYRTHAHARERLTWFADEVGLPWFDDLVDRLNKARMKQRRR